MNEWYPDRQISLTVPEKRAANGTDKAYIYLWIVPTLVTGDWRMEKTADGSGSFSQFARYSLSSDLLKANRMYVTCQVDEDLPYILKVAGEDSLMVGSDYTHRDSSMEYEFPRLLKERAEKGEITQSAVQKILYDNAKTFYGL